MLAWKMKLTVVIMACVIVASPFFLWKGYSPQITSYEGEGDPTHVNFSISPPPVRHDNPTSDPPTYAPISTTISYASLHPTTPSTVLLSATSQPTTKPEGGPLFRDASNTVPFKSAYDYSSLSLPDDMAKCIVEHQTLQVRETPSPLWSLVMSNSVDHVATNKDLDFAAANVRCYSQIHGINFFMNLIDNENVEESSHFFGKRWQTLFDRYIAQPTSKWVFQIDADTIIANMSKKLDKYMDTPAEVIFQYRRNFEVTAAMGGFRAASPFAQCFLKKWVSYGAHKSNGDNGDLLQILMDIVDPDHGRRCNEVRGDLGSFIRCFAEIGFKLRDIDKKLPIKVYFPFSGLQRSLECWLGEENDINLFRHCADDDFFVHGWKEIGQKHITPEIYKCDERNPDLYGPLKKCHWRNTDQTLEFAKKCCYEDYHGCHRRGTNVCRKDNPKCALREGLPVGYHDCKYQHVDCMDIPYH